MKILYGKTFCFVIIYDFYIYNLCEVRSCQVIAENRPFYVFWRLKLFL